MYFAAYLQTHIVFFHVKYILKLFLFLFLRNNLNTSNINILVMYLNTLFSMIFLKFQNLHHL